MIKGVEKSLAAIRQPRPYFDSESGPIDKWIRSARLDQEYHHNMSFAHLAAGGAGSGMRWPYSKPHYLLPPLRQNLLALARFAANVDWASFDSRNVTRRLHLSDKTIIKAGCADAQQAVLWLLQGENSSNGLDGLQVDLNGVLKDGAYVVELWETYQGCEFSRLLVMVRGSKLRFTLHLDQMPLKDVAIYMRPVANSR
jgi:mannan endo-1,4-beta-mannosidase